MLPALGILMLALLPPFTGRCSSLRAGPSFPPQPTTVRAVAGGDARLVCTVADQRDRAVSWVRSRDLQILTHGGAVFTADARVSAGAPTAHGTAPADTAPARHELRVARVRHSDAGLYECQLNTEPKMSLFFNLTVTESAPAPWRVTVRTWSEGAAGAMTGAVAAGGAVTLVCEAKYEDEGDGRPPLDIHWYIDDKLFDLQAQSARGGVSAETQRWAARAAARLTLSALAPGDAGRYACRATTADQRADAKADITLQVLDYDGNYIDNHVESMQRDQWSGAWGGAGAARGGGVAPRHAPAALVAAVAVLWLVTLQRW